jgi:ribonuclease E
MTRKRVGQGLIEAYSEECPTCGGRGHTIELPSLGGSKAKPKPIPRPPLPRPLDEHGNEIAEGAEAGEADVDAQPGEVAAEAVLAEAPVASDSATDDAAADNGAADNGDSAESTESPAESGEVTETTPEEVALEEPATVLVE